MRIFLATTLTLAALAAVPALAAETKIKEKDLPPAVQQAVKQHSQGATVVGFAKEVENGKTLYEAEMKVGERTKDVTFDADGKVVSVEEQVALESVPAPARAAIEKAAGKGKVGIVETVTEGGVTFYEAQIKTGAKSSEVKVDAAGKPVKK